MGFFKKLFGGSSQQSSGERYVKSFDPALEPYLERLLALRGFAPGTDEEAGKIGHEINDRYGFDGMVQVCDELRARGGEARSLELIWNGIGSWQG